MEMRDYVALGRKWLWLMVLAAVVAAASAWVATQFMPRTYRSQTTLMVGRQTSEANPDYSHRLPRPSPWPRATPRWPPASPCCRGR